MNRTGRTLLTTVLAVSTIAGLVACQPITHPTRTVHEPHDGPAVLQLLSGDGRVAVVASSGPGTTVPGAGTWRVERGSQAPIRVPDGAIGISRDGSRIAHRSGVWSGGRNVAAPAPLSVVSEDVTFGLHLAGGAPHRWDLRTGADVAIESIAPRPAGSTSVAPLAVSDDGDVVLLRYTFADALTLYRFARLGTGEVHDLRPAQTNPDADGTEDTYVLAADGSAFLHHHGELLAATEPGDPLVYVLSWVELVDLFPRRVHHRHQLPLGTVAPSGLAIADDGSVGWVTADTWVRDPACGFGSPTWVHTCVSRSTATAITAQGGTSFELLARPTTRISTDRSGRLLAVDKAQNPLDGAYAPPTQVVDRIGTPAIETLPAVHSTPSTSPTCAYRPAPCLDEIVPQGSHLSDDGRLVATASSTGRGWYEFGPPPA